MKCPKCGHVRTAESTSPDWQCPKCGIAYHKYPNYLQQLQQVSQPRGPDTSQEPLVKDGSIWSLLAANVLVLVISYLEDWSLANMLLVYCAQSLVIGVSYFMRMLSLDKFSTKNFKINNRSVKPTKATKIQTAIFFAFHFGFFHLVYLIFIFSGEYGDPGLNLGFYLCCIGFIINHGYSYRYHRDSDRSGTPNIGTMMFTPYARVLPMHLTIIFGAAMSGGGLLLFGVLKTGADVVMHLIEHKILSKTSE